MKQKTQQQLNNYGIPTTNTNRTTDQDGIESMMGKGSLPTEPSVDVP
jgi:hypothetical protein